MFLMAFKDTITIDYSTIYNQCYFYIIYISYEIHPIL